MSTAERVEGVLENTGHQELKRVSIFTGTTSPTGTMAVLAVIEISVVLITAIEHNLVLVVRGDNPALDLVAGTGLKAFERTYFFPTLWSKSQ